MRKSLIFAESVNKGNVEFDKYFEQKTMRFDYYHVGNSAEEHFAQDKIVSDGAWTYAKPHPGIFKRTPLRTHYSSFDSERYLLAYDNRTIRNIASQVPYDFMVIVVNEKTYGGGGIYNLYGTLSADNKFSEYTVIHELGHSIAGLADEYYTSSVSYEMKDEITVEPYEMNVTALLDKEKYKNNVGAFEGAAYMQKGLYRSSIDCIMFTRHTEFCPVCRNALDLVFNQYTK